MTRTVRPRQPHGWTPTPAFLTAAVGGAVLAAASVAFARLDLLVLGTPLLVITFWSLAARPDGRPEITGTVSSAEVTEGDTAGWTIRVSHHSRAEVATLAVLAGASLRLEPSSGVVSVAVPDAGPMTRTLTWQAQRWGTHEELQTRVGLFSAWAAFRCGPLTVPGLRIVTRPRTPAFASRVGMPHPRGLVGINRSASRGDGVEFADVRPFQTGDRLRRIHWPLSARTGTLHVRTAYAEQDTAVLLLLDASTDFAPGADVGGQPTSLDVGVRAVAALAQHFLARGDRVGMEIAGGMNHAMVAAASGRLQLRRIMDTLSTVERGTIGVRSSRTRSRLRPGAVVFLVSPILGRTPMTMAAELARRGIAVLIVDCLPEVPGPSTDLAWRIRLLERQAQVAAITQLGVPVTTWRGPGSLDQVLIQLTRRPAPHLARR